MLAAFDLLVKGHRVTILDTKTEPGGMLRWAIPEFRLPRAELDAEWQKLAALGVEFKGGRVLGRDMTVDELAEEYDAVIVAVGCPKAKTLGIPGEDARGVYHALEFLTEIRSGNTPEVGNKVLVLGGGEVALDAAQSALRLGAGEVRLAFLEGPDQMPVHPESLALAESEGVKLEPSWGPTRILAKDGKASGVDFKRCLAVFGPDGTFAPSYDECVLHSLEADTVIVAIGQEAENLCPLAPTRQNAMNSPCRPEPKTCFWQETRHLVLPLSWRPWALGRQAAESAHRLVGGEHLTYGRSYPGAVDTEFEIDTERGSDAERVNAKWRSP